MQLHGKHIIGHQPSAAGTDSFRAINPATAEALEPAFARVTPDEIDHALQAAGRAFETYRRTSGAERAAFLERIADEIEAIGDALIERFVNETALPEARARGERGRTTGQLRLFAQVAREGSWVDARIDTAIPDREPVPKPDLRRMLVPLGPVVVFSASNFPLAFSVAGGDTASALAAGCPVVVKAHWAHPGVSEMVATAVQRAAEATSMPDGVFSMLQGRSHDIGLALARHPFTRAIGFTGSLAGGRALFDAAAARPNPIPVYAEMGSINPVFVLPGALAERSERIAAGLVQSVTLGAGQFCTNPGLVIGIASEGLESLIAQTADLISQSPAAAMLYAGLCEAYAEGTSRLEQTAGVTVVGRSSATADAAATQCAPIVFRTDARSFLGLPELWREVFGPATLFVSAEDEAELERIARQLEGQLTATVHGTDNDVQQHAALIEVLSDRAGRLVVNGFPTGVEVCPSMHHGGPYPATTDVHFTSVGTAAILRFARPICFQDFPQSALPLELRDTNDTGILRMVNGEWTR